MRHTMLNHLLNYDADLANTIQALMALGWDAPGALVTLQRTHLSNVLRRYLQGALSEEHVEAWANAIEGREDIDYAPGDASLLADMIFTLANPLLSTSLTHASAQQWLVQLEV